MIRIKKGAKSRYSRKNSDLSVVCQSYDSKIIWDCQKPKLYILEINRLDTSINDK